MTQLGLGFFTRGVLGSLQLAGAVRGFLDHGRGLLGYQDWDLVVRSGSLKRSTRHIVVVPSLPLHTSKLLR